MIIRVKKTPQLFPVFLKAFLHFSLSSANVCSPKDSSFVFIHNHYNIFFYTIYIFFFTFNYNIANLAFGISRVKLTQHGCCLHVSYKDVRPF